MILQVFSVYDTKAEAFMPPVYMHSKGEMIRSFSDAANDSSSGIAKHPADYVLFHLGEWDNSTALYSFLKAPANLGCAVEFVQAAEQDGLFRFPEKESASA